LKKVLKIVVIIILPFLTAGFIVFKKISDKALPKTITGTYVSVMPGFVERKIIFRNSDLKGAYFTPPGNNKLRLNEDFTQQYISYKTEVDSFVRHGIWHIKNDSLLLFFPEDSLENTFSGLRFFNELYRHSEMTSCRDSTVKAPLITAFKKIE